MDTTGNFRFENSRRHLALRLLWGLSFSIVLVSEARSAEPAPKSEGEQPVVELTIPSIQHAFQDFKLLFDMARDEPGYRTFTDTLDEFLAGVDREGPCHVSLILSGDGMAQVFSAPVKNEAAFQKFVENLWDLDVKTAPPPSPRLQRQVPRSVQDKLHSLKPKSNERILFGLTDGVLRYEAGYVHLGPSLEAVRQARKAPAEHGKSDASVAIQIRGDVDPARRRAAFEKSKDDLVSPPQRDKFEREADFELAKAIADYRVAKLELLVADSSHVDATFHVSRDKKTSRFQADATPAKDTPLAKDVARIGQSADMFAGVSTQNAVVSASVNMPIDPALGKLFKSVASHGQAAANARIESSTKLDANQKQSDKDFSDLIAEIATDIAGMDTFNGVLRTWTGSEGKLTTVGAARVSSGEKFRERLQKFKQRERVEKSISGVELHRLISFRGKEETPELFDADGSVYVATSDKAIWFALGPQALERLEQAIQAAPERSDKASAKAAHLTGIDMHADMGPLAQVWDAIGSRQPHHTAAPPAKNKAKTDAKKPQKAEPTATAGNDKKRGAKKEATARDVQSKVADLKLHKLAGESFKEGDGRIAVSLTREGDKVKLHIDCSEGVLRFAGKTLSEFTRQNLAD